MKKFLPIIALAVLLFATPTFAKDGNRGNENSGNGDNFRNRIMRALATVDPSATPSATPKPSCEPEENENHGSFVSCIAHLHQGGKIASDAAKLHLDKEKDATHGGQEDNNDNDENVDHHSPRPSASASATPVPTPPLTSPIDTFTQQSISLQGPLERIIASLTALLNSLKNLH